MARSNNLPNVNQIGLLRHSYSSNSTHHSGMEFLDLLIQLIQVTQPMPQGKTWANMKKLSFRLLERKLGYWEISRGDRFSIRI